MIDTVNIKNHIRIVPDFPKKGINFYDVASLLATPDAFRDAVDKMARIVESENPDLLVAIESRGFLFCAPIAYELNLPFAMVRKKGKLPGQTLSYKYALEYGEDEIEIQPDMVSAGAKVVVIDDLLATGGTMAAAEHLVQKAGAHVALNLCLVELDGLDGAQKLNAPFKALLNCPA